MIRKIEIERFSLIASKQFDDVVAAINAGIGHPDMAELFDKHYDEQVDEVALVKGAASGGS